MSSEDFKKNGISIIALESGIEYPTIEEAPDEPLLIEVVGIEPLHLEKIAQHFEIDLEDLQDVQDPDERPRLQIEDKFTMIVLRVPINLEIDDRDYSTSPIGIFTNGRDVIILQENLIPLKRPHRWKKNS